MKKGVLLIISFMFFCYAFPQREEQGRCIIKNQMSSTMVKARDQIGDFTITDTEGTIWNLYDQLNLGKTVFIDLFYST